MKKYAFSVLRFYFTAAARFGAQFALASEYERPKLTSERKQLLQAKARGLYRAMKKAAEAR